MKRKVLNPDLVETGERIRALRESRCMSQEQLAERLGVSKNSISRYENGQMEMRIGMLYCLADVFGVSTNDLSPTRSYVETNDNKELNIIVKLFRRLNDRSKAIAISTVTTLLTNLIEKQ